jgi:hypothetical protein
VYYFPAVLLLIPNISSSVNWCVPHGLHKIAPVSLSLTASIYRTHKLVYVPSLYFYTPWVYSVLPVSLNLLNRPTDGATVHAAFVGFFVNLLNRPTDGTTVHALKSTSEKELLLLGMGVRKITFFTKGT